MSYHHHHHHNNNNSDNEVPITRRNTPHTIENCSLFVGRPISREQALAKMERSPQFADAVQRFGGSHEHDVVQNAVQLDYGMRLRSCLAAGNHHHPSENNHIHNNKNM